MKGEKQAEKEFVESFVYALQAPFLFFPPWDDFLTEQNKEKARMYRLASINKVFEEKAATDFEALMYIASATMNAPAGYEVYRIYMHLFRKEYGDERCDGLGFEKITLYDNEMHWLKRLKEWLFKRQMEAIKVKLRETKTAPPAQEVIAVKAAPTIQSRPDGWFMGLVEIKEMQKK